MSFQNLKVAVVGESHLNEICEAFKKLGYKKCTTNHNTGIKWVVSYRHGEYQTLSYITNGKFDLINLENLLKMKVA